VLCEQGKGATFGGIVLAGRRTGDPVRPDERRREGLAREPIDAPPPYWDLGRDATLAAAEGLRARHRRCRVRRRPRQSQGRLGSASQRTPSGFIVGALAAVNAVGMATVGDSRHFWAAPYEQGSEFGGHGFPAKIRPRGACLRFKGQPAPATATTIAMVATDATLTKAECKRLAIMANDGLARALRPVHAPNDGDTVFAVSTGTAGPGGEPPVLTELGAAAADCLARAVARGVYEATALPYATSLPDYRQRFGR
jgi:D-aminopeptidase